MVGKGNIIFDIGEEGCPWGGSLSILKQAKKWKYPVAVAKLEKICYNRVSHCCKKHGLKNRRIR